MHAEVRYHPDAEQLDLAASLESSLAGLLPIARLHSLQHEAAATWTGLEDIGLFSISASEADAGSGLGVVEETLIALTLGRQLASPGVLATLGAAPVLRATGRAGARVAAAWREGSRTTFVDEPEATLALVRDGNGAALHDARGTAARVVDERLWLATLREVAWLGEPAARLEAADVLRLRLLDAAALAGMADAALKMAVAYANTREQFGRLIGTFQAVKHHCADMAIAARGARDQASFAAVALADGRTDAALQVECALFVAGQAALGNAGKNIQVHGGMGFSDEADPHLFLKRAQLALAIAGGLEAAGARIAKLSWDD